MIISNSHNQFAEFIHIGSDDDYLASISDEEISLDDPARTLLSYGLTEEFTIRIYPAGIPFVGLFRFPPPRPARAHGLVLRSWDGDMRVGLFCTYLLSILLRLTLQDKDIGGLVLERGEVVYIEDLVHQDWFRGFTDNQSGRNLLLPRNFVFIFWWVVIPDIVSTRLSITYSVFDEGFRTELGDESIPLSESDSFIRYSPFSYNLITSTNQVRIDGVQDLFF